MPVTLILIIFGVVFFTAMIMFWASRYKRCPSNQILVVYGRVGTGRSSRCVHGGGAFIWPLVQDYAFLNLTPITISIPLQNALSFQNIRINVPSTFTVGVSIVPAIMNNAAERLLRLNQDAIEEMAKEIIFGQLRLTVAGLTIEQINQDRESFLEAIRKNVEPELNKVGLYLINVNITDITDESEYIDSIGRKAASEAVNRAKVDVADQEKIGAIGEAEANREKQIRVAENVAEAEKGKKTAEADRRIFVQGQESEAVEGENKAKANIADYNAGLAEKKAAAMQRSEVADRNARMEIQKAQYKSELERLRAEEVVKKEVEKRKIEIAAEAEAAKLFKVAEGQAEAMLKKYDAEARGTQQVLEAKAAGYANLVSSCKGDAKAAATFLLVEKLEDIVHEQVEAIKNIKIDKITVWDSGSGDGTSSTAGFVSSLVKSLPPIHEIAANAGVDLPGYLGTLTDGDSAKAHAPKKGKKSAKKGQPYKEITPEDVK